MGQAFHWAILSLAFLLELCALVALAYWGVLTGGGPVTKAALGIGDHFPRRSSGVSLRHPAPPYPCHSWGWG
jgi:hypothetical protein